MQINEIGYSAQISSFYGQTQQQTNKSGQQNFPSTEDTVSISAEGLAKAMEMWAENRIGPVSETDKNGENPENKDDTNNFDSLREEFGTYLYSENGKKSGAEAATPEEQIKALEKKIESLQNQLVEIEASSIPEKSKEQMTESIQKTIEGLANQIGSLKKGIADGANATSSKGGASSIFA